MNPDGSKSESHEVFNFDLILFLALIAPVKLPLQISMHAGKARLIDGYEKSICIKAQVDLSCIMICIITHNSFSRDIKALRRDKKSTKLSSEGSRHSNKCSNEEWIISFVSVFKSVCWPNAA